MSYLRLGDQLLETKMSLLSPETTVRELFHASIWKEQRIFKDNAKIHTSKNANNILVPLEISIQTFLEHNTNNNKEYINLWEILKGRVFVNSKCISVNSFMLIADVN